jgi:hypothetical protein
MKHQDAAGLTLGEAARAHGDPDTIALLVAAETEAARLEAMDADPRTLTNRRALLKVAAYREAEYQRCQLRDTLRHRLREGDLIATARERPAGPPEELEKRLTAMLIGAEQVLFLDNVNGAALRSDTMACAITERPAYVRILGSSTSKAINPITLVVVTGNGLVLSEDLARRFITLELDAGVEDPEARDFRGDLLKEVFEHRGALLRDALTIWRWGRLAGEDIRPGRPLGSFHDWGRWCREVHAAAAHIDAAGRAGGPLLQRRQLVFREEEGLHLRHERGERADVYADAVPAARERLD